MTTRGTLFPWRDLNSLEKVQPSMTGIFMNVERWAQERRVSFSHLYISKTPRWNVNWSTVAQSAQRGNRYQLLWDDEWATVLQRSEPMDVRWAPPGEFLLARDCQSFAQQPVDMQKVYKAAYGELAEWRWVQDYDELLEKPEGICSRLDRFGLGRLGLVRSLCGEA